MSKHRIKTQLLKFAPIFAFLGYGSWAFAVNYLAESETYIQSGVIQGSYALIATLFVRISALKIHKHFSSYPHTKMMTYLIVFIIMVIIPAFLHHLFSTEKIFYSVLPGAIIGGAYLFIILKSEVNETTIIEHKSI